MTTNEWEKRTTIQLGLCSSPGVLFPKHARAEPYLRLGSMFPSVEATAIERLLSYYGLASDWTQNAIFYVRKPILPNTGPLATYEGGMQKALPIFSRSPTKESAGASVILPR